MKLTISNVTRNNVNAIKALVLIALNQECMVQKYEVTDSVEALARFGYTAAYDLYWGTNLADIKHEDYFSVRLAALERAANPYEEQTPQWYGWNRAVYDAKRDELVWCGPIERYVLTAECDAPGDMSLLFRFAHQLGQTYRNCVVTMEQSHE